jgi:DUF917 family protein
MAPSTLSAQQIESLAIGAWILGTGGGGSPYQGLLNLRRLYREGAAVRLMDAADLADDGLVAVVSTMGAPLVMQERLADPAPMAASVRAMEDYLGRRFQAVMAVEIGGSNALQPCLIAAVTGLPVVDADAMGRAFPEAQMTSFAIHDLAMAPLTLVDVRDNAVIVSRAASWKWMERLSRKACVEVGSIAATCKAPRTGREVKDCAILGTVSKAIRIGETVEAARRQHRDPVQAVLDAEGGRRLFGGKVRDVERRTTEAIYSSSASGERLQPSMECSSKTSSATAYGGPASQESSVVVVRVVTPPASTSPVTETTSCGSRQMPITVRVPTSVQRHRRPPHQNSIPIRNSPCFIRL